MRRKYILSGDTENEKDFEGNLEEIFEYLKKRHQDFEIKEFYDFLHGKTSLDFKIPFSRNKNSFAEYHYHIKQVKHKEDQYEISSCHDERVFIGGIRGDLEFIVQYLKDYIQADVNVEYIDSLFENVAYCFFKIKGIKTDLNGGEIHDEFEFYITQLVDLTYLRAEGRKQIKELF